MDDFELKHEAEYEEFVHDDYFYIGSSITDFNDFEMDNIPKEMEWTNKIVKTDSAQNTAELQVKILHKTRGGKGKWNTIGTMELIRVTKGIGKRLRLEITSDLLRKDIFDWNGLTIKLFEIHETSTFTEKDFIMDVQELKIVDQKAVLYVELKIHHLCKNLQFYITYNCPSGTLLLKGRSGQFSTHDSGKRRKKLPSINVDIEEIVNTEMISSSQNETESEVKEKQLTTPVTYSPSSSPSRSTSVDEISEESNLDSMFKSDHYNSLESSLGSDDIPLSFSNDNSMCYAKKRKLDEMSSKEINDNSDIIYLDKSLEVSGIVRATNFVQYSDIRFKTNIEEITDALQIISHLQGKKYEWKSNSVVDESLTGGRKVIGLIAQEVKKIVPEAVHEDGEGYLSINYTDMVPLLIEALKQHVRNCEIDNVKIKEEISDLRIKMDELSLSLNTNNTENSNESDSRKVYNYILEKLRLFYQSSSTTKPKPLIDNHLINDERMPFKVSSITFPSQPISSPPPTTSSLDNNAGAPKDKTKSPQPAPIRMINCIVDLARSTLPISSTKETPPTTVARHSIFRNLDLKASLLTPGYTRKSLDELKGTRNVSKAVVISMSGWLLWCKSNEQGLSRYVSDTERESLQICHRAVSLLEETFPDVNVEYFGMELRGDTQTGVEDLCYEVFKQVKSPNGEITSLRQKLEEADLVWFIGHTQGVVPCVFVCDRLLKTGIIDANRQMVNILSFGGYHKPHSSPLSLVHPNSLISKDMHTFPQNKDFLDYKEALTTIVEKNVHITMVSAFNDTLVDLATSSADYIHHPNILRSLFVNNEHKSLFEPNHTFKKANNLAQEMILLSLEMKNKYQYDIDALQLGSQYDYDFKSWIKNTNDVSLNNLQNILYDQDTEMPKTFVNLFYELKATANVFSTWGYKFHKTTKFLKEGIERHYQMTYNNDSYVLSLEHMLQSWKPNTKCFQPSLRDSNEAFYISLPKQIQSVKKIFSYDTSKLESSFKYWKPTLQKEILVQSLLHESLGWPVRQSFFEEYVDGIADFVIQEKESMTEQIKNTSQSIV